jgi:3'(2'), 5'-bisphosphate nucleotidase
LDIRSKFNEGEIILKGDGSPVTQADMAAHELIVRDLSILRPEWPIVSEEGSAGDITSRVDFSFLVDPLDGTKEFIRGNGMYTVNIAVMSRNENNRWDPILGVVHAPEYNATWFGGRSVNATLLDSNGLRSISAGSDRSAPIVLGSVSHSSPRDRRFCEAIGEHIFEGVGSSIKICRVADGSADLTPRFGPTSCWDTAAAHAILNSAGGNLLGPDGNELDYDIKEEVLNPWFLATSGGLSKDIWLLHQEL